VLSLKRRMMWENTLFAARVCVCNNFQFTFTF